MATKTSPAGTFGSKLRAEFDSRPGFGARTLAKLLVAQHGSSVDVRRRTIIRWLNGTEPNKENREMVEDALGLERDSLKGDDDEEEDAAVMVSLLDELIRLAIARRQRAPERQGT